MAYGGRSQPSSTNPVDWNLVTSDGPSLAFHAGCVLRNNLYVHGGVTTKDGRHPSDKLFCFNSISQSWSEITSSGSPALSHHACVPLDGKFMLLIGGWDGRTRSSKVIAFDVEEQKWIHCKVTGFPEDAGLSSHTATLLDSREILILGREGSLRMQRRHGSGYLLKGSVELGQFHFTEYTQATASRSGHTTNVVGNKLYVIGGRDNNLIEMHAGFKSGIPQTSTATSKLTEIVTKLTALSKIPGGRKNHVTIGGAGCLFIHGGETFDGRSREPVGEMFLVTFKPVIQFYKLGVSEVKRAGHVCHVVGDKIILHGGTGGKSSVFGDTYSLGIVEQNK